MNLLEANAAVLQRITAGNAEAQDFLVQWNAYVHQIDDIMDGDRIARRDQLKTFALAITVYSHPFYLRNLLALRQVALNVTIAYADVVDWETSTDDWKRAWADHNRHVGMDMAVAVATICAGTDAAFEIGQELRNMCWHAHHDEKGKPV